MPRRFLDISTPIHSGMAHWPSDPAVSIELFKSLEAGARSQVSKLTLGSHTGTHVDAPRHYIPAAPGVDQWPLDRLVGPCQVADLRGRKAVSLKDVRPLDVSSAPRILLRTDNSSRLKTEGFFEDFVYLEKEAAAWLVEHGAVLVGIDGFSIDRYHAPTPASHMLLLRHNVVIVEGLCLDEAPAGRYDLICLPIRLQEGDGAPARAVLVEPGT